MHPIRKYYQSDSFWVGFNFYAHTVPSWILAQLPVDAASCKCFYIMIQRDSLPVYRSRKLGWSHRLGYALHWLYHCHGNFGEVQSVEKNICTIRLLFRRKLVIICSCFWEFWNQAPLLFHNFFVQKNVHQYCNSNVKVEPTIIQIPHIPSFLRLNPLRGHAK